MTSEGTDTPENMDTPEGADTSEELVEIPRRGRVAAVSAVVLAVVVVALVWVLATGGESTDRAAYTALAGQEVPPVAGESVTGDGSFDIADHAGSWVVVNFFATWCPPCVQEHPELVSLDEAYQDSGEVALVSVVYDDDLDEVAAFFERHGGDWPVITDADGRIPFDFGVTGVPETYIIDPFGVVQRKLIGGVTRAGIEREIGEVMVELEADLTGEDPIPDVAEDEGGEVP